LLPFTLLLDLPLAMLLFLLTLLLEPAFAAAPAADACMLGAIPGRIPGH